MYAPRCETRRCAGQMRCSWIGHRWRIRSRSGGRLPECGRCGGIAAFQGMKRQKNQHFFELFEIRSGLDANLLEGIIGLDLRNRPDGQVARENAIHAAGNHARAHAHVVVVWKVFHGEQRLTQALHGALYPGVRKLGADAAVLVCQEKHLRSVGVRIDDFSDDAIGSDHSEILADAVMLAAVQLPIKRTWESRLICTARRRTWSRMTPASSTSDLWRECMAAIFEPEIRKSKLETRNLPLST